MGLCRSAKRRQDSAKSASHKTCIIPSTAVDGFSDLFYQTPTLTSGALRAQIQNRGARVERIRTDPPTAVGDIWPFCAKPAKSFNVQAVDNHLPGLNATHH